jgi:hypothetical protein
MTDSGPERRPSGEQVVMRNGPTWKWLVGAIAAAVMSAGSVYVKARIDQVRLEERFESYKREQEYRHKLQDNFNLKVGNAVKRMDRILFRLGVKFKIDTETEIGDTMEDVWESP